MDNTSDFELIIVDNHSNQNTLDYLNKIDIKYKEITIIYNKFNSGFAHAVNQGLRHSTGHYKILLNNDTVVKPGWADYMIALTKSNNKIGIVGSLLMYPGEKFIQHCGVVITKRPDGMLIPHHIHRFKHIDDNQHQIKTQKFQAVTGACFLITEEAYKKIGNFSEQYLNGYEDVDYCFRAGIKGFDVYMCAESLVVHYESMTPGRRNSKNGAVNQKLLDELWGNKIKPNRDYDEYLYELKTYAIVETAIHELITNKLNKEKSNVYKEIQNKLGNDFAVDLYNTAFFYNKFHTLKSLRKSLTIIIPVFNCIEFTKSIVSQIFEFTHSKFQLIIIDNGSTDGTVEYLKTVKSRGELHLIENKKNKGYSYANNQGIDIANSEYICFLNNDVMVFPSWDFYLINAINHTDTAFVGPVTNSCTGMQCDLYGLQAVTPDKYQEMAIEMAGAEKLKNKVGKFQLIGFCLLGRTNLIKKLNGFDEGFKLGNFEDFDLTLRGMLLAEKNAIVENCFIYHHGSKTFSGNNLFNQRNYNENAMYFVSKWGGKWEGKRYIPPNSFDRSKYRNVNYLTGIDNDNIISLGNYGFHQTEIDGHSVDDKVDALESLMLERPFNPDVMLALVDSEIQRNDTQNAFDYSATLKEMTPQWKVAIDTFNSFSRESNKAQLVENLCRLSVCIISRNEEDCIERCLRSVSDVAFEIIVLDTGSTDNTVKIAKNYTDKVYHFEWNNDFSVARNKCLEHARGDWVLFIDCDEELAPDSSETLKADFSKSNILGLRLPLENVGSPLHGFNYVPRLVRNAPGLHFIGKIHETIFASLLVLAEQWNMEQGMGKTKILHHGYTPDELQRKGKLKRNLALYEDALAELPDEPSIMMNYAHDLNHDGQTEKAYEIFKKIHGILEQHKTEDITPEVREQFMHNYGVFLTQEQKMEELVDVMFSRTARDTGPVANVHYMAGLGLINCKRFEESISELELCVKKAFDDSLAPSVPDVRTWKPRHLLANAYASLGDEKEAIRNWEEVLVECDDSPDPFHDYARYLSSLNRNKEAIKILIQSLDSGLNGQKIWELGAGIVNSDPELAGMAMNWTEEAVQYFPESDVTNVRRGEALMKDGRYLEAIPFFERLTRRGERNATAAQLICKKMMDQLSAEDLEKVALVQNELKGWTEIMDKAPGEFDRELAEQLIQ